MFQISLTYLFFFKPGKGLCLKCPYFSGMWNVLEWLHKDNTFREDKLHTMSVSFGGKQERERKVGGKELLHITGSTQSWSQVDVVTVSRYKARDELPHQVDPHPRGRCSHLKQTYPGTWESHEVGWKKTDTVCLSVTPQYFFPHLSEQENS